MKRILLTGATGFIGSNLARKLLKSGKKISIFLRKESNTWRIADILSDFDVHFVNISDFNAVKKKIIEIKPDVVFHCASYGVYRDQHDLTKIISTNILGSVNLMQALELHKDLQKFVNVGSAGEYGPKLKAVRETENAFPLTPYSISKATQTNFAQYFALKNRFPSVTLRVFNVYGMYEEPGRLIPDIMVATIRKQHLNLFSRTAKRDFVFINDVVDALIKASTSNVVGEIFNIGGGREYSVEEVVDIVSKMTKTEPTIVWGDRKKQREIDKIGGVCFSNIEKATQILDWKPNNSLKQGLSKTYEWYKKNISFYDLH